MAKATQEVDYSKPLKNKKYEAFCQQYMVDSNGAQAAIRAGYSEKGANAKGSQLLTIISIKNRLAVLQCVMAEETGITAKMVAAGFKKIATGTTTKTLTTKHKLRALENLGKHTGFYGKDNEQKADALTSMLTALDGETRGIPG